MIAEINLNRQKGLQKIKELKLKGYIDRGWANNGKTMNGISNEEIDISLYKWRKTHIVYVSHVTKELLHVDMSD